MILRKINLWTFFLSLHLLTTITAQNARSYDENDWIPITPSDSPDSTKKAQGRVLNLNAPSQNYFPENEYLGKRAQPQQYIQDSGFQKGSSARPPKAESPYKFEPVLPLQPPQYIPQNQFIQQQQFIAPGQQIPYVQTLQQVQQARPIQEQNLHQQLIAPSQNTQNYYDTGKHQFNAPINSSFLQSSNVLPLNQELLGAIQHQNLNQIQLTTTTTKPKEEKESVQLLYVPLENLQPNQPVAQQTSRLTKQNEAPPRREKQISRQQNKFDQLTNIQGDFIAQALAAHKLQQQLKLEQPVLYQKTTTSTTPQPRTKKPKPNQPPLSVYMEKSGAAEVKDVLDILKQAKTISVQDSVGPGSPKVFVGPSNIDPEGYVKFPLPYLSSVQGNRIERKVEQLPFFVAPLSYKTPEGYSKIPLPSPHVGSVVVSTKQQLHEKNSDLKQPQTAQNQIVQDYEVKQPYSSFKENPNTNSYLLNQNNAPTSQNALLGFGNEFLSGFNSPPSYEVSSSKGFTNDYESGPKESYDSYDETPSKDYGSNYQLGLRDNSQYYETTPSYKPTERTRVRGSFEIPDYQSNEREIPTQNTKELVRDYDIPSLPVESKTSFTPNYQVEAKQQVNEFPSSIRQNSPSNDYNFNAARSTTTTTTESAPVTLQNQLKFEQRPESVSQYNSRDAVPYDPFKQVINQYEIEQINSQFREEKPEAVAAIRSTTPTILTTRKYNDYNTPSPTARTRSRTRQRGRPAARTTTITPQNLSEENYTVLEEFAVYPKTSTAKYTTEVETIPAKVYKLEQQPGPAPVQTQAPLKQLTLNQETLDEQILHENVPSRQIKNQQFLIENTRPSAEDNQQFAYSRPNVHFNNNQPSRQNYNQQILENIASPKPVVNYNQRYPENSQSAEEERSSAEAQDPRLTPLVYNRGQDVSEEETPVNSYIPGLINNLQDQAVRPLLIPNLLVPTTEKISTVPPQLSTEEVQEVLVTSTEAPKVETTTQRRTRGRQRAQTRYTSTTSPRRAVSRRRPNYTRPTTERQYVRTTTEATDYEPTRRVNNQRQRFRTRGRPVQKEQESTERIFKTTNTDFRQPSLEGGFQSSSADPASYMQFQHVVDNQQVITIRPEQSSEETPMREYHQVYNLPQQGPSSERSRQEVSSTSRPTFDVKITHPVTDRTQDPSIVTTPSEDSRYLRINNNIQSGGYYNRNEESSSRAPARSRVRSRTRNRFSSTTPRIATTRTTTTTDAPKSQEDTEQEFYGFIRQPEFNKPQEVVQTTTQQSIPLYSENYQQTPKTLIQMIDDDVPSQEYEASNTPTPVFVGQIRPKYTTTESQEVSTEVPKSRQRARIRIPNRKVTPQQQSDNEVKSQKFDDQVTRRSSIVRNRSRGKNHYRIPENVSIRNKNENLEGQNYPVSFLKSRELSTEKPASFQITIDPSDEETDQEPHPSLYSPQVVKNTGMQWVEASVLAGPNSLENEDKQYYAISSEEQTTEPIEPDNKEEEVEIQTESTDEELPTTTEFIDTTTQKRKKLGRRRGAWKLVKQKPIESIEGAESQNYYSVVNSFDSIEKKNKNDDFNVKSVTKTTTPSTATETTTTTTTASVTRQKLRRPLTTTEASIFDTLYSMLGLASKASQLQPSRTKIIIEKEAQLQKEVTTTTNSPTFPEEITEETTTQEIRQPDETYKEETTFVPETTTVTTTTTTTTTTVPPPTTITTTEAAVKNYDVEPIEIREVKTSTSTEVSHETEICYKGRCIKSKDEDTGL